MNVKIGMQINRQNIDRGIPIAVMYCRNFACACVIAESDGRRSAANEVVWLQEHTESILFEELARYEHPSSE